MAVCKQTLDLRLSKWRCCRVCSHLQPVRSRVSNPSIARVLNSFHAPISRYCASVECHFVLSNDVIVYIETSRFFVRSDCLHTAVCQWQIFETSWSLLNPVRFFAELPELSRSYVLTNLWYFVGKQLVFGVDSSLCHFVIIARIVTLTDAVRSLVWAQFVTGLSKLVSCTPAPRIHLMSMESNHQHYPSLSFIIVLCWWLCPLSVHVLSPIIRISVPFFVWSKLLFHEHH